MRLPLDKSEEPQQAIQFTEPRRLRSYFNLEPLLVTNPGVTLQKLGACELSSLAPHVVFLRSLSAISPR